MYLPLETKVDRFKEIPKYNTTEADACTNKPKDIGTQNKETKVRFRCLVQPIEFHSYEARIRPQNGGPHRSLQKLKFLLIRQLR